MKQPSNVSSSKFYFKVKSNSYYFGCSQSYYLYQIIKFQKASKMAQA